MRYLNGDLIAAAKWGSFDVIAQCCNCQNTMKSGIAPLIARAFPEAHAADQATAKGSKDKLGHFSVGVVEEPKLLVYNLYGQFGYWNRRQGKMDLSYEALDKSLSGMRSDIITRGLVRDLKGHVRVGVPKMGAGLAGGDWNIISGMIESYLGIFDLTVVVKE